jgi:hypothetical protein
MKRVLVLSLIGVFLTQPGCITDLSGSWDGEVDCGANGSVDMFAEIESRDTYFEGTYEGSALIDGLIMNDLETEIEMDLKFAQSDAQGSQILKVKADCSLAQVGLDPVEMDCGAFDELGWDGSDTLSGTVGDFLELFDCKIELRR